MKKKLNTALEGQVLPPAVYLPPALSDGKLLTTYEGYDQHQKPTIEQQRIRIQVECDPLGQLMAMANGLPIPKLVVKIDDKTKEPVVVVEYETADMKTRIALLTAMLDKTLPNASVTESTKPKKDDSDGGEKSNWADLTRDRGAAVLAKPSS